MSGGRWLLLERTENLLSDLYRIGDNPDPLRLFDATELAHCEEESPLLVSADANPSLAAAVHNDPGAWPGLLLESARPVDDLLAHLRHILFIRFDAQRKGVLRYCSPRTASYFFPACDETSRAFWLGPIRTLSWHGGTWRDSAHGRAAWLSVENARAAEWNPAVTKNAAPYLDKTQEQALRRQQHERFLYPWWQRQSATAFETAWQHLAEGMDAGFVSAESLQAYLDLRSAYPQATPPAAPPPGDDAERLAHLARHLQRSPTDKERTL